MSHVITVGGLLKFLAAVVLLILIAVGLLYALARGMSDRP